MSPPRGGLIALTPASRLSPMATAEGLELASPHPQARAHALAADATERCDPADRSDHSRPHGTSGQPGTSRTASPPNNPLQNSISPAQTKAAPRIRDGCGPRDEREGDAISNGDSGHQDVQHRSTRVGFRGVEGAFVLSRRTIRLCPSSRAPSIAGRSPYHSEPSIEAPDSSTLSRQIKPKTP
jgi:hypothetical protein